MRELLQNIFGTYTPVVGASGVAALDIEYISGVLLFLVFLCGIISLLRVLLKK